MVKTIPDSIKSLSFFKVEDPTLSAGRGIRVSSYNKKILARGFFTQALKVGGNMNRDSKRDSLSGWFFIR